MSNLFVIIPNEDGGAVGEPIPMSTRKVFRMSPEAARRGGRNGSLAYRLKRAPITLASVPAPKEEA